MVDLPFILQRKKLQIFFSATLTYDFETSYNIAPTRIIPAVIAVDHERLIVPFRWGLIPSWYKEGNKLAMLNNARAETVDSKPSFRQGFRQHRCLIIADGFYEWDAEQTPKQPYYIHMQNNKPLAMAGIWSRWLQEEKHVESCCILTLSANHVVEPIHDRMPAIIANDNWDAWLDPSQQDIKQIKKLLTDQSAAEHLQAYPVSTQVNKSSFDEQSCILPL